MVETRERRIESLEKHLRTVEDSPLFAQLAGLYLESGKAQKALEICDHGLAHHPFYTTAHLIKGKALLALEMKAEARRELELVYQFYPQNDAVAKLLKELGPAPDHILTPPETQKSPPTISQERIIAARKSVV